MCVCERERESKRVRKRASNNKQREIFSIHWPINTQSFDKRRPVGGFPLCRGVRLFSDDHCTLFSALSVFHNTPWKVYPIILWCLPPGSRLTAAGGVRRWADIYHLWCRPSLAHSHSHPTPLSPTSSAPLTADCSPQQLVVISTAISGDWWHPGNVRERSMPPGGVVKTEVERQRSRCKRLASK